MVNFLGVQTKCQIREFKNCIESLYKSLYPLHFYTHQANFLPFVNLYLKTFLPFFNLKFPEAMEVAKTAENQDLVGLKKNRYHYAKSIEENEKMVEEMRQQVLQIEKQLIEKTVCLL